jgi:hypothetical protein
MLAIRDVAPPGGWSVFVTCIKTIESETDKAEASHNSPGMKRCIVTPIMAEIRCPPIKFLGCASGLLVIPNNNTAVAPKEPIKNILSDAVK